MNVVLTCLLAATLADSNPAAALMERLTSDLQAVALTPERQQAVRRALDQSEDKLDRLVHAAAGCFPEIAPMLEVDAITSVHAWPIPAEFSSRSQLAANLNLYVGRELVRSGLSEEGLEYLDLAGAEDVVDPAALTFFKAAAYHQLGNAEQALVHLDHLMQEPSLPARYADTARLMRFELASLKPKSLQAIAHDMRRLSQRLDNGRTGEKVQMLEKDVVDRLDQLIEELEKQQQQQNSSASNTNQPTAPMEDSRLPVGGGGEGEVGDRVLKLSSDWGKLPAKERERALQQLDRRYPSHYREAVEEYFRRLAETEGGR